MASQTVQYYKLCGQYPKISSFVSFIMFNIVDSAAYWVGDSAKGECPHLQVLHVDIKVDGVAVHTTKIIGRNSVQGGHSHRIRHTTSIFSLKASGPPLPPYIREFPRIIRGNWLFLDTRISKNFSSLGMPTKIYYMQFCWLIYIFNPVYVHPTMPQPHHLSTSLEVVNPLRCRWVINMHQWNRNILENHQPLILWQLQGQS